ncbi:MAG TPA: hypothetical protein VH063_11215 [Gaiellaceae bacterium]|jgi:hypothetical protein|nr:hypothetical protein [Gaiellaceae bacterium]
MARVKLRSRREVIERIRAISEPLKLALSMLPEGEDDPAVIEAVWQGEGLGMLLWSLGLAELEPYDRPFDAEWLLATPTAHGSLRAKVEIEHARETARLWHWRARTDLLRAGESVELPADWDSFEQLIAVAAMRGYERGLLPSPLRGDFPAHGTGYRELSTTQRTEVLSIAWERQRALEWLCGAGKSWVETPTAT